MKQNKSIEDKLKRDYRAYNEELISLQVKVSTISSIGDIQFYKDRIDELEHNIKFIENAFKVNNISLN
jgi:hypothetical protein